MIGLAGRCSDQDGLPAPRQAGKRLLQSRDQNSQQRVRDLRQLAFDRMR